MIGFCSVRGCAANVGFDALNPITSRLRLLLVSCGTLRTSFSRPRWRPALGDSFKARFRHPAAVATSRLSMQEPDEVGHHPGEPRYAQFVGLLLRGLCVSVVQLPFLGPSKKVAPRPLGAAISRGEPPRARRSRGHPRPAYSTRSNVIRCTFLPGLWNGDQAAEPNPPSPGGGCGAAACASVNPIPRR